MINYQKDYLGCEVPGADIYHHQVHEAYVQVDYYQTDYDEEPIWELSLEELL